MTKPQQIFYESGDDLAQNFGAKIIDAFKNQPDGLLILPGGSSPRALITVLGQPDIDWASATVTTSDERCVDIDSEFCNAKQIADLSGIEPYYLWQNGAPQDVRRLNWPATVTVLGMGNDAHIASLFPGQDIDMKVRGVIKGEAPVEPRARVSLSMRSLLETNSLNLLVIGAEKWALCERILMGEQQDTPLALMIGMAGDKLTMHIVKD